MPGYLYQIVNTINGKRYIGSSKDPEERERAHFSSLIGNRHHSIALQRAFNKYGKDKFTFNVIKKNIRAENIINEEQKEIDLKSEYNSNSTAGIPPSQDVKSLLYDINGLFLMEFDNLKSCCLFIGSKSSRWGYIKGHFILREHQDIRDILHVHSRKYKTNKKVYKYNEKSMFICVYNNVEEAILMNGKMKSGNILITKAIKHKTKSLGFFWSYSGNVKIKYIDKRSKRRKIVKCIDINTGEEFIFKSQKEAACKLSISKTTIYRQLSGITSRPSKFLFKYL